MDKAIMGDAMPMWANRKHIGSHCAIVDTTDSPDHLSFISYLRSVLSGMIFRSVWD